jgi:hypothetical protein
LDTIYRPLTKSNGYIIHKKVMVCSPPPAKKI